MKKEHWMYMTVILFTAAMLLMFGSFYAASPNIITTPQYNFIGSIDEPIHMDNIAILSLDPDALDQVQTSGDNSVAIGSSSWLMQSGYNDREPFTGFLMCIAEHGTTTQPIYIGVMLSPLDPQDWDNWAFVGVLNPDVLPKKDTFYWIGFDLESDPLPIDAGEDWYLLAMSMDDPSDGNCWAWKIDDQQSYSRGTAMAFDGNNWHSGPYDMAFKTYTIEGNGGGDGEPSVTITSTYQVAVYQFLGSVSLLGAVISGTKYFLVV